jgi:aerobic-type carbon monoxide dehydrogenase small subunit (CoxS/CutS family)
LHVLRKRMDRQTTDRLQGQWPKRHTHAAGYFAPGTVQITRAQWKRLPFAYRHTDAFCTMEARHCRCGSTLVVLTAIHDPTEE